MNSKENSIRASEAYLRSANKRNQSLIVVLEFNNLRSLSFARVRDDCRS